MVAEFSIVDGVLRMYAGNTEEIRVPEGVKAIGGETAIFRGHEGYLEQYPGISQMNLERRLKFSDGPFFVAFRGIERIGKLYFPKTVTSIFGKSMEHIKHVDELHLSKNVKELSINCFPDEIDDVYFDGTVDEINQWNTKGTGFNVINGIHCNDGDIMFNKNR